MIVYLAGLMSYAARGEERSVFWRHQCLCERSSMGEIV